MREDRSSLWAKWEEAAKQGKLKGDDAIWGVTPGLDLIPEIDLPLNHSYFFDGTHSCPPLSPLSLQLYWARACAHGLKYVNSYFSLPTCYGWEGRARQGGIYWSFLIERDEKKIKERQVKFREALKPFMDDFDGIWQKNRRELFSMYDGLKKFNPATASRIDYIHFNWELERVCFRQWEIHFLGMQSSYSAWILLEEECKKRFGVDDKSADFQDMLRGFDNEIYKVDRELWVLAKTAVDMGLADTFKEKPAEAILSSLEQSSKGKEWIKKFNEFLQVRGWRSTSSIDFVAPYWLEDPTVPVKKVKELIVAGEAAKKDYVLDTKRKEISALRESAVKRMLNRVPDAEKAYFESLIKLAQKSSSYSEEHDLICEMTLFAIMRWGYLAIGKWLCDNGCIDRPDDIFMLNTCEIEPCVMVPHTADMRWITRKRRADWESWTRQFTSGGEFRAPVYTDRPSMQEAVAMDLIPSLDPICIKIVVGELPTIKAQEIGADIMGICGCPGVAEGPARVITDYKDLGQLRPGDILVCPATNPEWTTAFGIAAGVVADRGGTLSHAAIIGREYGVPTIVNTFVACEKIKSGQRIKIDATKGAIFRLDK